MTDTKPSYLVIDPGKMNGWCEFNNTGEVMAMGQFPEKDLTDFLQPRLDSNNYIKVLIEKYTLSTWNKKRMMSNFKKGADDGPTLQIIGAIKILCKMYDTEWEYVHPQNYPTGAAWGGFHIPTNHSISHQWVAAAHGIFYLQQAGIRKPQIVERYQ